MTLQKNLLRQKQRGFVVPNVLLILLINTVGAPNQLRLMYVTPLGISSAEPTPDMQSEGKMFVERVNKTEHCRLRAGFS